MRPLYKIGLLLCSLVLVASCSDETPTQPLSSAADKGMSDPVPVTVQTANQVLIDNYIVQYDGRTYDGTETTFAYTVFGTGVEPALSHFTLELPDCAPDLSGYSPTNSVSINYDPATELYGIDWHLSVAHDDTVGRPYSITFPGDVPEGVIHSAVKAGDTFGVGQVYGPCDGFQIAGDVFVDADADGQRDLDESGIADVVVEIEHADATVDTVRTDALGHYAIIRAAGDYTVRIAPTPYPGAFNVQLFDSFDATTPVETPVTIGPDATGNDFGFSPQSEEIIFELESGILLSDGESVRFWTREVRAAMHNGGGNATYDTETMLAFLAEIQTLYLDEVFQFTPGNELAEAYAILKNNSREPIDELKAELLATEFNEVSGRGLVGENAELQDVLIAWGESLVVDDLAMARSGGSDDGTGRGTVILVEDIYLDGIQLFRLINTGGGGGVDE